jgi:hypothetical protein
MTQDKPIIEPERAGLWAAAAFILALLAFVLAFAGIYRSDHMLAATQIEILALNQKIEDARKTSEAPAPMSEVPAPMSEPVSEAPAPASEPAAEQPAIQ